jgi:hypothetical protein
MMFPKPEKKKKKSPYTEKKADEIFSKIVRMRGTCQAKGLDDHPCGGGLQCAHIITRGMHKIRFHEYNALCLCAGHHSWYTHHPDQWILDFIPTHFPKQYAWCMRHRRELLYERTDFKMLIEKLELELISLQENKIGI